MTKLTTDRFDKIRTCGGCGRTYVNNNWCSHCERWIDVPEPSTDEEIAEFKNCAGHPRPAVWLSQAALIARIEQEQERFENGTIGPGFGEGWEPVAAKINQLPRVVREWVAELQTRFDPAGDLCSRRLAEDEAKFHQAEVTRLREALEQIKGGHGVSDDVLERAFTDGGALHAHAQGVARAALEPTK